MNADGFNLEALLRMKHSPVRNYAIPGLTSSLIGNPSPAGTMRLFECDREHQEPITPHSHRFNFQCWVLRGGVRNRIWTSTYGHNREGDDFHVSTLHYKGEFGQYSIEENHVSRFIYEDRKYGAGECYSMKANEVHSIFFERRTVVLFFEGPTESDTSFILEPYVDGEAVKTFKVEPWMFKKEGGK